MSQALFFVLFAYSFCFLIVDKDQHQFFKDFDHIVKLKLFNGYSLKAGALRSASRIITWRTVLSWDENRDNRFETHPRD